MSGLKSALELSLERSAEHAKGKLSDDQKNKISEIRLEYKAKIADKEVILDSKINRLEDRTPPEQIPSVTEELKKTFFDEKKALEDEMESKIEAIRNSGK